MRHPARSLAAAALLIAAALGFLVYQGLSDNLVYYITPSQLLAKGAEANGQSFRLGGLVKPGTQWNKQTRLLRFVLADPHGEVRVVSHGLPPEMFRPKVGVVVEGKFVHGVFDATTLMVKHCSTYVAPRPGQTPPPDTCVTT
ncbi:MAG: cytochrome c maturation protein CcmE [Chloroflexota bacterium]